MAVLDIVVLLLVGGFGVRGLMKGFVKEVLSLCAVVAGIIAVRFLHAPVTGWSRPGWAANILRPCWSSS